MGTRTPLPTGNTNRDGLSRTQALSRIWKVRVVRGVGVALAGVLFAAALSAAALALPSLASASTFSLKSFATGGAHSLAVRSDGTLWAWGYNINGQLGLGDKTRRVLPTQVGDKSDWVTVGAGTFHSFAVNEAGELWAWGINSYGQLGLPLSEYEVLSPTRVGTASNWVEASGGDNHSVGLRSNGTLWVTGDGQVGQLGLGSVESLSEFTQISPGITYTSVEVSTWHNVALADDGSLYAWGYGVFGALGLGDQEDRDVPTRVGSAGEWTGATLGIFRHGAFAVKQNGELWGWGKNEVGELGLGGTAYVLSPTRIGTASNWKAVAGGEHHSVAVRSDGTLWSTGANYIGQLGLGSSIGSLNTFTRVGTAADWTEVSSGQMFSIAGKSDGTLWGTGDGWHGQLGNSQEAQDGVRYEFAPVLLPVAEAVGTNLSFSAPSTMRWDKTAALSGYLRDSGGVGVAGKPIRIERSLNGGATWSRIATVTTGSTGRWSYTYNPTASYERPQRLRVRFLGDTGYVASGSTHRDLRVTVTLWKPTTSVKSPTRGKTFTVRSYIAPRFKSAVKPVRAYFYKKTSSGSWKYVKYVNLTTAYYSTTRTKLAVKTSLSSAGSYRVRLRYDGAKTYRGYVLSRTYSSYLYFTVKR